MPVEPPEAGASTGEVARRLGVSPTTVRSWERRYGIGPAERAAGRHRRWTARDVAVLEEMCRLTASGLPPAEAARLALGPAVLLPAPTDPAPPAAPASPPAAQPLVPQPLVPSPAVPAPAGEVRPEVRGLARAARRLDSAEVAGLLRTGVERLGAVAAWTDVMAPALRAAGRRWAADGGERYVEVEHLLSWHVSSALRRVAEPPVDAGGSPVLLAAMPGEQHTLALEAVAAGLAERGLPFRIFGAALPAGALAEAVRRTGPAAVLLWSQTRATADPAPARAVAATAWGTRGARVRPVLLAAGPGWQRATRPPGALAPRDLPGALDLLARAAGRGGEGAGRAR
ncbi:MULTISPECIES: MerR family transcriptional regulator [Kitasatospora]|uniref:Putative MerR family transcriptional regulator n=1 Tax=Kitasatospora setae (strain ATCC 33774 / DSM 43861 / JCM 3304 / KCC A-0304 / NBRC 14216 / KM-6054) TaxID=452652 RepID=E4N968_KITSK|nr:MULTISPECIES: MerR family transcriptional regulator [Kitasatospora]BAJ27749.1 putative MerR family transcriptional regulator [Kitasatospora setae KM-6054]